MNQELSTTEAKQMKPMIFSTPMVQAILAGRKTQTRRIIKPQPIDNREVDGNFFEGNHKGYVKIDGHPNWQKQFAYEFCPYGKVGDILYVRETIYQHGYYYTDSFDETGEYETRWISAGKTSYVASDERPAKCRVKPSIHMPRAAARIFLKITDISVERLQDISQEDAKSEGVDVLMQGPVITYRNYLNITTVYANPVDSFRTLWTKINGLESWNENPWIWKISFEQTTQPNEDARQ